MLHFELPFGLSPCLEKALISISEEFKFVKCFFDTVDTDRDVFNSKVKGVPYPKQRLSPFCGNNWYFMGVPFRLAAKASLD